MRLVVVGDTLLDRDLDGRVERLCPEAPVPVVEELARRSRPGGAGLAAALASADGHDVTLVTALAEDTGGRELASLLASAGVEVLDLGLEGATPEKVRIRSDERLLLRIDHGGSRPSPVGLPTGQAADALFAADAVLVSDYGRGVADGRVRRLLPSSAPVVWDPHPRGPDPVPGAALVTPNLREVGADGSLTETEARARALRRDWEAQAVAVTMGANGALLVEDGNPALVIPAAPVVARDPCGAGDRFASTATALLAAGADMAQAVTEAVAAASSFVAAGGAGAFGLAPPPGPADMIAIDDACELVRRVRERGGRVVATGGCFDLLHAGHVGTLEAARALGDCLIVCLNSDASIRRLKGSDRPLVQQEERARVLRALRWVDAVVVFDEDTPAAVLERLRPDVFAKGGDYNLEELAEARLLARWGGETAILPFVEGHSTTRLLEEAAARAG
jgi:rfaE bifunctional protein nucleotidyltransferase chain/domain/rfaE bifunctional protein kinase chain/domain